MRKLALLLGLVAAAGALVGGIWWGLAPGEGPAPVPWDRAACAFCRMHVGEPAHAAQMRLADGGVLFFDDPGCFIRHEANRRPEIRGAWFHALEGDGWIPRDRVAFVPVSPTPMDSGLGAVERGTPGALSYEEAVRRVLGDAPRPEARR